MAFACYLSVILLIFYSLWIVNQSPEKYEIIEDCSGQYLPPEATLAGHLTIYDSIDIKKIDKDFNSKEKDLEDS